MDIKKKVEVFFKAVENKDRGVIATLFAADSRVYSPNAGSQPALPFFDTIFSDSVHSAVEILGFFHGEEPGKIAAHFRYTRQNGQGVSFPIEGVDLFSFDTYGRIAELKMLFPAV